MAFDDKVEDASDQGLWRHDGILKKHGPAEWTGLQELGSGCEGFETGRTDGVLTWVEDQWIHQDTSAKRADEIPRHGPFYKLDIETHLENNSSGLKNKFLMFKVDNSRFPFLSDVLFHSLTSHTRSQKNQPVAIYTWRSLGIDMTTIPDLYPNISSSVNYLSTQLQVTGAVMRHDSQNFSILKTGFSVDRVWRHWSICRYTLEKQDFSHGRWLKNLPSWSHVMVTVHFWIDKKGMMYELGSSLWQV